jgi:hypothetical protein
MKETIRTAVARAAFVSAYADAIDSRECLACEAMEDGADLTTWEGRIILPSLWDRDTCRNCNRRFPRARSGEDWMDATAELKTPPQAWDWADAVLADFVRRNGVDLETLCLGWMDATGEDEDRFGHCLAMQYLGHGVGLGDDIPPRSAYRSPECGWREFHASGFDFASLVAQPEALQAFDEATGSAVFVDADGDPGAYAIRPEGSGIGNAWAMGAGFEFYSSNAEEVARIRAADCGEVARFDAIGRALKDTERKARDCAENS